MTTLNYHFSGVAGAGMNPLARLMRARGHRVQGSDRALDQGLMLETAALLRGEGIALVPHDGAAIGADLDRFVYSTAVEAETPEWRAARALEIPMLPLPALLAELVNAGRPGVAISGTCGKSTVTGLVAWLVETAGRSATVIGGAPRIGEGIAGGLSAGPEHGPTIAETCESDGHLDRLSPGSRRHPQRQPRSRRAVFAARAVRRVRRAVRPAPRQCRLPRGRRARPRGRGPLLRRARRCGLPPARRLDGPGSRAGRAGPAGGRLELDMPLPGLHNLENAAAAALVALELGGSPEAIEQALPRFPGLARRFEVVGVTPAGIRVVDDYAHNPEKIRAALTTAQAGCDQLVAVFQPHGFGPVRFMRSGARPDAAAPAPCPRPLRDAEVFYAGGTVVRDVSGAALAADLPGSHRMRGGA